MKQKEQKLNLLSAVGLIS